MDFTVLQAAIEQGVWAVLFVSLLLYLLQDSRKREERLMGFLDEITKQFDNLDHKYERISGDVTDIKTEIRDLDRRS
mgnify:CR=1 FL=1